jgi:hypothetical protein
MQRQSQSNTMERSGDKFANGNQQTTQNNQDGKMIPTVTPDNDNGTPGQPIKQKANVQPPQFGEDRSSNKDQGPAGENL